MLPTAPSPLPSWRAPAREPRRAPQGLTGLELPGFSGPRRPCPGSPGPHRTRHPFRGPSSLLPGDSGTVSARVSPPEPRSLCGTRVQPLSRTPENGGAGQFATVFQPPTSLLGLRCGLGTSGLKPVFTPAPQGYTQAESLLSGAGPQPPGAVSSGLYLGVGVSVPWSPRSGWRKGCGTLAFRAVPFLWGPRPPLVPNSLSSLTPTALGPGRLGEQRSGPFACPYSQLWPPLEGGAWLKVMPGCLPARGLSPDPQCHLPHRLGEVRCELVPGD